MEKLEQFGGETPLGRPGQPVELASIYVQLAAQDASYTTGQIYGAPCFGASPERKAIGHESSGVHVRTGPMED
jgi:hypothetical protein